MGTIETMKNHEGETLDSYMDRFFEEAPVPHVDSVEKQIKTFVTYHKSYDRPVVCVTSGGTTVPLERRCVRFIDNFSRGNRGALSVEQFLKAGYAVIFISRTGSAQPFVVDIEERISKLSSAAAAEAETAAERGSMHGSVGPTVEPCSSSFTLIDLFERKEKDGNVEIAIKNMPDLVEAVRQAQESKKKCAYLRVSFTTVFEYLAYLRVAACALRDMGRRALMYLPAAVSDFFVPWNDLAEHKIQSSDGALTLNLKGVPKALRDLRMSWAPDAMIVSFKLETDEKLLARKAAEALGKYDVDLVVANLLETRKETVYLVFPNKEERSNSGYNRHGLSNVPDSVLIERIDCPMSDHDVIEKLLVSRVVENHQKYCAAR